MHTRESVRAVGVNDSGEVLLSRVRPTMTLSDGNALWVTLGGRISPGEDLVCALKRELREEPGRTDFTIGPKIWFGDEIVTWGGKAVRLVEHFFHVRVPPGPCSFVGTDNEEVESTHELRWWQADQILASRDRFVPKDLGDLMRRLGKGIDQKCLKVMLE
jgi:8-oxo-dGTP diphosphatase